MNNVRKFYVREFYVRRYRVDWRRGAAAGRFEKMWYKTFSRHLLPQVPRSGAALEVGAGYGFLSSTIIEHGLSYTATDIAETALSQIPASPRSQAIVAAAEDLPFDAGSFDLVLCMEVLEHVEDVGAAISECFRVAKPRALLVFSIPTYLNAYLPLKYLADRGNSWCRNYMVWQVVDRNFMPWSLDREIRKFGTIVEKRAIRLAPPFFEKLEGRADFLNDAWLALEERYGNRFPLSWLGLHTMITVRNRS